MIAKLHFSRGARKIVSLEYVPSKLWLRKWLSKLSHIDDIILFTAGKDAYGSF